MLLRDHLRLLMAPGRDQWKPMLMGLALSAAAAGAAVLVQPNPISLVFLALAFAAWFVGAYAMVGYLRWFLAGEVVRARQENPDLPEQRKQ